MLITVKGIQSDVNVNANGGNINPIWNVYQKKFFSIISVHKVETNV